MKIDDADAFIRHCQHRSSKLAHRAIAALADRHGPIHHCCVLDASGRRLPSLSDILASHALIHAAEGEFYRAVVADAARRLGLDVRRIRERDLELAAEGLPGSSLDRRRLMEQFGKQTGPPWRQDEKRAAIAAWIALAAMLAGGHS